MQNKEYELKLSQAIIESFGYKFEELYNCFKDNIIEVDLIVSMIEVVDLLIKDISDYYSDPIDDLNTNKTLVKNAYCVTSFFLKMKEIYEPEMLKTLKMVTNDGEPFEIGFKNKDGEIISAHDRYKLTISSESAFEFLLSIIIDSLNNKRNTSIYKLINELTKIDVSIFECNNCMQYKYLQKCNCKYTREE